MQKQNVGCNGKLNDHLMAIVSGISVTKIIKIWQLWFSSCSWKCRGCFLGHSVY